MSRTRKPSVLSRDLCRALFWIAFGAGLAAWFGSGPL